MDTQRIGNAAGNTYGYAVGSRCRSYILPPPSVIGSCGELRCICLIDPNNHSLPPQNLASSDDLSVSGSAKERTSRSQFTKQVNDVSSNCTASSRNTPAQLPVTASPTEYAAKELRFAFTYAMPPIITFTTGSAALTSAVSPVLGTVLQLPCGGH
jgi:hypothetical protein